MKYGIQTSTRTAMFAYLYCTNQVNIWLKKIEMGKFRDWLCCLIKALLYKYNHQHQSFDESLWNIDLPETKSHVTVQALYFVLGFFELKNFSDSSILLFLLDIKCPHFDNLTNVVYFILHTFNWTHCYNFVFDSDFQSKKTVVNIIDSQLRFST